MRGLILLLLLLATIGCSNTTPGPAQSESTRQAGAAEDLATHNAVLETPESPDSLNAEPTPISLEINLSPAPTVVAIAASKANTVLSATADPTPPPTVDHHGSPASDPCEPVPEPHKARCEDSLFLADFDPNNIAQVARFNFSELHKFSRMSKLRSGVGHDYSFNTDEYDESGINCRSMKHYFLPVGAPLKNELYATTPHTFEWMSIKFFAPADGVIQDLGEEHQFTVESTEYAGYYFKFHHVQLLSGLEHGSSVVAGQQIGTLAEEDAWGEIGVEVRIDSRNVYLLSFLQVATDAVLKLYQDRGLTSVSDVIITKEQRDMRPLACNRSSAAGWFEGGGRYKPDTTYMVWQYESPDNWFYFD